MLKKTPPLSKTPKVIVHPISISLIHKGHPWIIEDQYTKKFPNTFMLVATDKSYESKALMLNDPKHPIIKARVWSIGAPFQIRMGAFWHQWDERLHESIMKRIGPLKPTLSERENQYLVFGESDSIPGVFIQKLGNQILVQFTSYCWNSKRKEIFNSLTKQLQHFYPDTQFSLWFQLRVKEESEGGREKDKAKDKDKGKDRGKKESPFLRYRPAASAKLIETAPTEAESKVIVEEFGVKYQLNFGEDTDFGIFTDMSSIRKKVLSTQVPKAHVLNLFAHTGAYSLSALAFGAEHVTSIDLSPKNCDWLAHNLKLNPELTAHNAAALVTSPTHDLMSVAVNEGFHELKRAKRKFDRIICDPPTTVIHNKKKTSSLLLYKELLPQMISLLKGPGSEIVLFINTQKIKKSQFQKAIAAIISENKLRLKRVEEYEQDEDCQTPHSFPEGKYIKGQRLQLF
jgi:23S rRNA (cytosine1962-C5)-methyltransferase